MINLMRLALGVSIFTKEKDVDKDLQIVDPAATVSCYYDRRTPKVGSGYLPVSRNNVSVYLESIAGTPANR